MNEPTVPRANVLGIVVVAAIGFGALALAFYTFGGRLQGPFGILPPGSASGTFALDQNSAEALLADKKDTDGDGLTDSLEIQIYRTSPYLEDTDSDGVSDSDEIAKGTDPNCPEGTDCRAFFGSPARDAEREGLARSLYESAPVSKLGVSIPGLTDPATVRSLLKQAGIPEEALKQFSDEMLLGLVEEGVQTPSESPPSQGGEQKEPGALPENPTPEAIRELLVAAGLDRELLAKFTDAQLTQLYQETLKEVQ